MERITTPAGITVSYEKSGSGPPLVLVHGSPTNQMTAWMLVKPLLEPQFTVYAVARRGRGETSATKGHTIPEEGADVAAVIEAIGKPVYLLGHSFGAQVSLAAAALIPDQVLALVLYEPPLPTAMNPAELAHSQDQAEAGDYDGMVDEFFRKVVQVQGSEVDFMRSTPVWAFLVSDGPASIREWPALLNYQFDADRFRSLDLPVLLLTGSESPQDIYATDALAAALPNATVGVLAGQGHGATVTAPKEFVDAVASFLNE